MGYLQSIVFGCWATCLISPTAQESTTTTQQDLKQIVAIAFAQTHNGWSSDEVILQTELNQAFIDACRQKLPNAKPADLNWTLLNLRKAGKLEARSSRRATTRSTSASTGPIGEMCARVVMDRHRVSIDRLMTDPKLRAEFDAAAKTIDANADLYAVRKAAFRLRKIRQLKPELITRIADWGRKVTEYRAKELAGQVDRIPETPGIYVFRDATGYLYIGEAINLRKRLAKHLDESDRQALASYLRGQLTTDAQTAAPNPVAHPEIIIEVHTFADDSRIKDIAVRRAYESELIRSREPRFNVRP
jgi:hypothetical protein